MDHLSIAFSVASTLAAINWIIIIVFSNTQMGAWFEKTKLIPLGLSLIYAVYLIPVLGKSEGGFSSLEEVSKLFSNQQLLLAGWVHYLAFDLLVGYQIRKEGVALGVKNVYLLPFYLFTFMLGPIGYLAFRCGKGILNNRVKKES